MPFRRCMGVAWPRDATAGGIGALVEYFTVSNGSIGRAYGINQFRRGACFDIEVPGIPDSTKLSTLCFQNPWTC